jgi:hypothetical protein
MRGKGLDLLFEGELSVIFFLSVKAQLDQLGLPAYF